MKASPVIPWGLILGQTRQLYEPLSLTRVEILYSTDTTVRVRPQAGEPLSLSQSSVYCLPLGDENWAEAERLNQEFGEALSALADRLRRLGRYDLVREAGGSSSNPLTPIVIEIPCPDRSRPGGAAWDRPVGRRLKAISHSAVMLKAQVSRVAAPYQSRQSNFFVCPSESDWEQVQDQLRRVSETQAALRDYLMGVGTYDRAAERSAPCPFSVGDWVEVKVVGRFQPEAALGKAGRVLRIDPTGLEVEIAEVGRGLYQSGQLREADAPVEEPDATDALLLELGEALGLQAPDAYDLPDLARLINLQHSICEQSLAQSLQAARTAGDLLAQARERIKAEGSRTWLQWLQLNFKGSQRTAYNYLAIAERWAERIEPNLQHVASLRGALELLTAAVEEEAPEASPPPAQPGYQYEMPLEGSPYRAPEQAIDQPMNEVEQMQAVEPDVLEPEVQPKNPNASCKLCTHRRLELDGSLYSCRAGEFADLGALSVRRDWAVHNGGCYSFERCGAGPPRCLPAPPPQEIYLKSALSEDDYGVVAAVCEQFGALNVLTVSLNCCPTGDLAVAYDLASRRRYNLPRKEDSHD